MEREYLFTKNNIIIFLSLILSLIVTLVSANDTIVVTKGKFYPDELNRLILVNQNIDDFRPQHSGESKYIILDTVYQFVTPIANVAPGIPYIIVNSTDIAYTLYFTQLPVININVKQTIVDDYLVFGSFILEDYYTNTKTSSIGIELRGNFAQTCFKKSYLIKFYSDTTNRIKSDIGLLGMRDDNEWNLMAMNNEPLKFNNKTSHELWKKIGKLYYQNNEPEADHGVDMEYVELFLNNNYQGIYLISERVDRKQLKLKKFDNSIRGELYKGVDWGASIFSAVPAFNNNLDYWSGFEYEYPDEIISWQNLYDFVDFVLHEEDSIFFARYQNYFNLENAVDYFIFLNLLRATDNTGKNIFIAKYDLNTPYFYIPWDLDGTLGTIWDGTRENITDDLLSNGFYKRLFHDCSENGFAEQLKYRWKILRSDILTKTSIEEMIRSNYNYLANNGVYERESMVWKEYTKPVDDFNYTLSWLDSRLKFLDKKFSEPCITLNTGITANHDNITLPEIYPNPANHHISIKYDDFSVNAELKIFDNIGQVVYQNVLNSQVSEYDISNLGSGLYLIWIKSSGKIYIDKLIINR